MMGNTFGKLFRITTCGESYSGCFRKTPDVPKELYGGLLTIVDGVPAGIKITADLIQAELDKRRPGQTPLDSPRLERDKCYIFSGVMEDDLSTGAPVGIVIPNNDIEDIHVNTPTGWAQAGLRVVRRSAGWPAVLWPSWCWIRWASMSLAMSLNLTASRLDPLPTSRPRKTIGPTSSTAPIWKWLPR